MSLKNTDRIVHCKEYNDERKLRDEWWEVECFKSKWWSFGSHWFVETQAFWSSGGDYYNPMRFGSEQSAFEYIERVSTNVPKNAVIREPVTSFI